MLSQASTLQSLRHPEMQATLASSHISAFQQLTLVSFADVGHTGMDSQLCNVFGLLVDPPTMDTIFYLLLCVQHNSWLPVCSTAGAEILAAGGALEKLVALHKVLETVLAITIHLEIFVDSPSLFVPWLQSKNVLTGPLEGESPQYYFNTKPHSINLAAIVNHATGLSLEQS